MGDITQIDFPLEVAEELANNLKRFIAGKTIAIELKAWKQGQMAVMKVDDMGFEPGNKLYAVHLGRGFWLIFKKENIQ